MAIPKLSCRDDSDYRLLDSVRANWVTSSQQMVVRQSSWKNTKI